jgi:hypothetical protein
MRAITHVEGKVIGSSRRGRRGAGWWLRKTVAPPAGRRFEQPDCVAAGVGGPSVLSQGAHARMDVPVGEGSARPHSGRSRDVRPRPAGRARFLPRLQSSARARTARSLLVPRRRLGLAHCHARLQARCGSRASPAVHDPQGQHTTEIVWCPGSSPGLAMRSRGPVSPTKARPDRRCPDPDLRNAGEGQDR